MMKIIATSDWHLGNLFHGNDRLPEHRHFLQWLLAQIREWQPDALLVAGDIFDNGNPSAAAQSAYYAFLADATQSCPQMKIIITAGNHDSANRLEAPRALLTRYKVEVRGTIHRFWEQDAGGGSWKVNYDDLMIPVTGKDGETVIVLAVPYLRGDIVQNAGYSQGVNNFLHELTSKAREKYPDSRLVMMVHMYAKGADIAAKDASEKIVIGGEEEVNMEGWDGHPFYMTSGHIHKRQHIWNTDWARYTGSILPMSFAEVDYRHGVDLITIDPAKKNPHIDFLEYVPQHKLKILPANDEKLSPAEVKKLVKKELPARKGDKPDDDFIYLLLKVQMDKVDNDAIKELEAIVETKNAVLCKIQKLVADLDLTTVTGAQTIHSIDDILDRDPLETLKEAYTVKHNSEMNAHQEEMLKELVKSVKTENGNV